MDKFIEVMIMLVLLGLAYSLVFAYFAMLLWNYAVTDIFGLPEITYWQTFALMVLIRLFVPLKVESKS